MGLSSFQCGIDGIGPSLGGNNRSEVRVRGADGYYREPAPSDDPNVMFHALSKDIRKLEQAKASLQSVKLGLPRYPTTNEQKSKIEAVDQQMHGLEQSIIELKNQQQQCMNAMARRDNGKESLRL